MGRSISFCWTLRDLGGASGAPRNDAARRRRFPPPPPVTCRNAGSSLRARAGVSRSGLIRGPGVPLLTPGGSSTALKPRRQRRPGRKSGGPCNRGRALGLVRVKESSAASARRRVATTNKRIRQMRVHAAVLGRTPHRSRQVKDAHVHDGRTLLHPYGCLGRQPQSALARGVHDAWASILCDRPQRRIRLARFIQQPRRFPMFALPVAAALLLLLIVRAFVPRRRPGARGRVRSTVLATLGMAGLMVVPAAAWASPPYHGTFSSHEVFVDSEVCAPEGFSVDVVQDEVLAFRVFFAPSGAVAFVAVHVDYRPSSRPTGTRSSSGTRGWTPTTPTGRHGRSETPCTSKGRARGWFNTMQARSCSSMDLFKRSTVPTPSLRASRSASPCSRSRKGVPH